MTKFEATQSTSKLGMDELLTPTGSQFDKLDPLDPAVWPTWAAESRARMKALKQGGPLVGSAGRLLAQLRANAALGMRASN